MRFFPLLCVAFLILGCSEAEYVPKPKGYNRIDLPKQTYQSLTEKHPYTFEYSKHSYIRPDSSGIAQPHWIYIIYPKFKANVQLTYRALNSKKDLMDFVDDSNKLMNKHMVKATSIQDAHIKTPSGKYATVAELEGEVPSQFQFWITDSTKRALRGALYFRTATKNDSLAPIIEYIKTDIIHLLNTMKWDYEKTN